jgi:hypothetical protein
MNADDTDHKEIYSERILPYGSMEIVRILSTKGAPTQLTLCAEDNAMFGILSSRMVLRAKRNNLEGILFRKDLNASPHCRVEDS